MDELDRELLGLLRLDARVPVVTLAKKLKVSRGTVQNRIARMQKDGIIQSFTVKTRSALEQNRIRAVMCIAIEGERSGKAIRALRGLPEVDKIHTTNGRWDLVVELVTDTLAGFSKALDQIRTIEGIASTETSILLATPKS